MADLDRFSDTALAALRSAQIDSSARVVRLVGQLDRKVYEQVNDILTRLGGKWNKAKAIRGHLFDTDPAPLIAEVLETGRLPEKNPLDFFPTPFAVIEYLAQSLEDIEADPMQVLEPSAGRGDLVIGFKEFLPTNAEFTLVEVQPKLCGLLRQKELGVVVEADFLELDLPEPIYDLVIMNPPFTAPGNGTAYIDHIEHALRWLKTGGQLISVTPIFDYQQSAKHKGFRELVKRLGTVHELPAESFKESGTSIPTRFIHLTQTGGKTVVLPPPVFEPAPPKDELQFALF